MPPTPYAEGLGQMDILYSASGLTHRLQFPVVLVAGSPITQVRRRDNTAIDFDVAASDYLVAALKPWFPSSVSFTGWEVQVFSLGAFYPVASDSLSIAGTGASAIVPTQQLTYVFRDENHLFVRHVILETGVGVPASSKINGVTSTWLDYKNAVLPATTSAVAMGNIVRSRAGDFITDFSGWSSTLNKRLRRARGYL